MNYRNLLSSPSVIFTEKVNPRRKGLKALRQEAGERVLVEAARQDLRRFAELYELHFHQVHAYVVKRVQTREEAEDVTSDAFHRALAKIKDFEWRGVPFSAWLIRIAANAMADRWKRTQREGTHSMPDNVEEMNVQGCVKDMFGDVWYIVMPNGRDLGQKACAVYSPFSICATPTK